MSKSKIEVHPTSLYFPHSLGSKIITHPLYINNQEKDYFLCVNIVCANKTVFEINPSNTITIPPMSSKKVEIVKKMKFNKDVVFHVMCKFIENVTEIVLLSSNVIEGSSSNSNNGSGSESGGGWNKAKLYDIKVKTSNKKISNYTCDIKEEEGQGGERVKIEIVSGIKGLVLDERKFDGVKIRYGKLNVEDCVNKWKMTDLYYLTDEKKIVCLNDLQHEIQLSYCPNCFNVKRSRDINELRGRCDSCVECPLCGCNLNKMKEKKKDGLMYFHCFNCNWSSNSLKLIAKDSLQLTKLIISNENENKRRKVMKKLLAKCEKQFEKFIEKEDFKKKTISELNDSMPSFDIAQTGNNSISPTYLMMNEKKQVQITHEKNTVPVNTLIKNPDPFTKLFAEKTFNYEKILSTEDRRNNPEYSSIIKREIFPNRKKLLSKKVKKYNELRLVKPEITGTRSINSLDFYPNQNAVQYIPSFRIVYFDRLYYNKESIVQLKIINPNSSSTHLKLFHVKKKKTSITTILSIPPSSVKILGRIRNVDMLKNLEETERKFDGKSPDKAFLGQRTENTLVVKIGVTPKLNDVKKDVKFTLQVDAEFDISGVTHKIGYFVFFNLGKLESSISVVKK